MTILISVSALFSRIPDSPRQFVASRLAIPRKALTVILILFGRKNVERWMTYLQESKEKNTKQGLSLLQVPSRL